MKKVFIILCSLAVMITACKKNNDPDYTPNYVGNYLGQFSLTITSMNNQPQSSLTFPIDGIKMDIAKGEKLNAITATVTVEDESHQAPGTATAEKADFDAIHLTIDKPDQNYSFNLNLKMEGTKAESDTLNITGAFGGNGKMTIPTPQGMQEVILDEVSGTITGKLAKQ